MKKPIVAIIGRPNVGKSTLFNRLLGKRMAIVEDTPGVTRDRHYAPCPLYGREMILVDTGGLEPGATEGLLPQMRAQTEIALEEADIILFLLSNSEGLLPSDREIHDLLRKTQKKVFYIVNKVDSQKAEVGMPDFYAMGIPKIYPVSAEHGRGVEDVIDDLLPLLPESEPEPEIEPELEIDSEIETKIASGERLSDGPATSIPRIAVIGRPNVGKSTLINMLLSKERLVTSPIPGTTRDSIDTQVLFHRREYCFVDTAGLRKKARVIKGVESYSVLRTLRALEQCDVAILVIDAMEGITDQDARIAQYIQEAGKGAILLLNKWDLVPKDEKTLEQYQKWIQEDYAFMSHLPQVSISALTGQRLTKIFAQIDRVVEGYQRRIPTNQINRFFQVLLEQRHLPSRHGHELRVYYGTQVGIRPPSFVLFTNHPQSIPHTFTRFIENRLRDRWGFEGVPLRVKWRKK